MLLRENTNRFAHRVTPALAVSSLVEGPQGIIMQLDGQLRHDAMGPLQEFCSERLTQNHTGNLVINCKGISFVDSQGLALLLIIHRLCQNHAGKFTVQDPPAPLMNLLKLTRFDSMMHVE